MNVQAWTYVIVGMTFTLYMAIAIWSKAKSTGDFYVSGRHVHPVANGMATAADWMSAASFISMAGIIALDGRDGSRYLIGWTGGYVLLALLLAPYLRKFGKFTVPDFVGDRYYSSTARLVAAICALFVSFTYVAGQMQGVGIVFSRFLEVPLQIGVLIGMGIVFIYAVLGGMKGITYTQVAQYCVLIVAYLVPIFFISIMLTGNPIPQLGMGSDLAAEPGVSLLDRLDQLCVDLGFNAYTDGSKSRIDLFFITLALMVGTAGLPHVIIRFFTVPKVSQARSSAGWALLFIALLYTTAPALAVFARTNLLNTIPGSVYSEAPDWFKKWETTGLITFEDKNQDGLIQFYNDDNNDPAFLAKVEEMGWQGNELQINRDIVVLANPEIANLPDWVVGLVAAGGLAAALSTAAGLLLVISTSFAHDIMKRMVKPDMSDKEELLYARIAAAAAVCVAGYFGINPPGFVAQVVAFAFGLAAASFFPIILLGIFSKRMNKEGAIAGMIAGITFTAGYIAWFKLINPDANVSENWLFGISPEGIGGVGMVINLVVALAVSSFTPAPPEEIQELVEDIRIPRAKKEG